MIWRAFSETFCNPSRRLLKSVLCNTFAVQYYDQLGNLVQVHAYDGLVEYVLNHVSVILRGFKPVMSFPFIVTFPLFTLRKPVIASISSV